MEWQDSMPTQQWPVQDSTPTQRWTTNSQSRPQQPSQGQYRDLGASQMPDDWFRDPEAERTRVMAAVPENPVFTPPPPPSTPAMAYPPLPSGDSPRHRKVLIGLVVGLLVLVVLGAVLLFLPAVSKGGRVVSLLWLRPRRPAHSPSSQPRRIRRLHRLTPPRAS
ncbi:hypothetical protein JCM18909_1022 [Cutibacterium acnes JCM 18909]|nr:hypothetical protein JCM18909_1022 [Cutibacterium acnes JCM 18909]